MTKEEFNRIVLQPGNVVFTGLSDLEAATNRFPYCQLLQVLLAKKLHTDQHIAYPAQLKRAAAYAPDRTRLFRLIQESNPKEIIDPLPGQSDSAETMALQIDEILLGQDKPIEPQVESVEAPRPEPVESPSTSAAGIIEQRLRELGLWREDEEDEESSRFEIPTTTSSAPENLSTEPSPAEPVAAVAPVHDAGIHEPSSNQLPAHEVSPEFAALGAEENYPSPPFENESAIIYPFPEEPFQTAVRESDLAEDPIDKIIAENTLSHELSYFDLPRHTSPAVTETPVTEANPLHADSDQHQSSEKPLEHLVEAKLAEIVHEKPTERTGEAMDFSHWLKKFQQPNSAATVIQKVAIESGLQSETLNEPLLPEIQTETSKPAEEFTRAESENSAGSITPGKDDLIERFIRNEPRISPSKSPFYSPANMAKLSVKDSEDFSSETLARIYAQQGNFQKAISIYRNLGLKFPQKNTYFAALIQELEDKLNS